MQRVSGFGLGIFAMLFLPHLLPDSTAAATISCLFSCGTSTFNAIKYRRHIPFRIVLPLLMAAMVVIPIAVHFSTRIHPALFQCLLGIVLIGLSLYFLFFQKNASLRPTLANGLITGALGGALNGLFSTGGPPIVLYLTSACTENIVYFSAIQFYFSVTNLYATGVRLTNGLITKDIMLYARIGFVGCMAGDLLGSRVFDRLDPAKLKRIIYIGMILSGVTMIL